MTAPLSPAASPAYTGTAFRFAPEATSHNRS